MKSQQRASGPEAASGAGHRLTPPEAKVADAVGNAIEFWGFKRNHGRLWALLYLRAIPMTANELQEALDLSKGAVSMIVREMEQWGVIHRVRPTGSATWSFVAETNLMRMVARVIEQREAGVIHRVQTDLAEAEELARSTGGLLPEAVERLGRIRELALLMEQAVAMFLQTSQLNMADVAGILQNEARPGT
jgi:HTH-type transcriptional regulator, glycine betaine synthesis regulator